MAESGQFITVDDLDSLMGKRDAVFVVDVRSPDEFAAARVPSATNIPLPTLEANADTLPRDAVVVTVCGNGGGRSESAAELLRRHGFQKRALA